MKISKTIIVGLLVVGAFALSYFVRGSLNASSASSPQPEQSHAASEVKRESLRIVSMAPSSCEALYAIGLGDQVVGVSRFTKFPEDAAQKSKVGGYMDVDLEAIVHLQPSHVVLLQEQADLAEQLKQMGMTAVMVDHMTVEGILDSIKVLGAAFGAKARAQEVTDAMQVRIDAVQRESHNFAGKSVLYSIGREVGLGKVHSLVAAGAAGFHQELLGYANLTNAYTGAEKFPQLTRENLITLNPEVIIDMVNSTDAESIGVEKIRADWQKHTELQAVRHGQVHLLVGDKYFIPGPRFPDILEWLSQTVHGGVDE